MKHHWQTTSSVLFTALASAFLMIGLGCSSEADAVAPPLPQADPIPQVPEDKYAYFVAEVYPRLNTACAGCHADGTTPGIPKFLGSSAETAYTSIQANVNLYQSSTNTLLIKKGEHQGPALALAGQTAVAHWLDLERPPSATPTPVTAVSDVDAALAEFGKCMSIDDWQSSGMSEFPSAQTLDSGPCQGCHMNGLGGTFLNPDFTVTFNANRQQPYILKLVEPQLDANGSVRLRQSERLLIKGDGICPDVDRDDFDICHPEFDFQFDPDQEDRLRIFVGQTLAKLDNGICPF